MSSMLILRLIFLMKYHLRYYSLIFAVEASRWTPLKYILLVFVDVRLGRKGVSVMLQIVNYNSKQCYCIGFAELKSFFCQKTGFKLNRGQYYNFYGRKLRLFIISCSVCPWKAFPA